MKFPVLKLDESALLRPLGATEVTDAYVRALNDPVVHEFLVGPRSGRQTLESVREFVQLNSIADDAVLFGFFLDDELRGTARLHDIRDGCAFLGVAIFDSSLWGQGWGTRIVRAVAAFAGEDLRIDSVKAVIESANFASLRVFEKAGFRRDPDANETAGDTVKETWVMRGKREEC